jgi:phenylalanyl-tRNA synthetase beta chain
MKASYNWLQEFVDFTLTPDKLGHALTMAGLEVEADEIVDGDTIFDIGVTPNRPDWLSMRGMAREISAVLELPIKDISAADQNEEGEGPDVEIENAELCPRYAARIITGVKPGPSPDWLAKRLESCGIRPVSNIVDITNYILLEIGQPMHAFDLDKLSGKKIVVKEAGNIDAFTTLDGEKRKLTSDMLLIWDAEKPVAVAGVMGGSNTEVSDTTVNVLLESAYFNPSSVRRTSKTLNLSSESAYRFERGVDREAVVFALDRAAQMVAEIAGGNISSLTDVYPKPYKPGTITVSVEKICSVIGADIAGAFIEKALGNLGCKVDKAGESLTVTPPSFRNDMERDIDVVEEVARLYGYDNIPSTLPVMHMSAPPEHKTQELGRTLKNSMVSSGFSEAVNFSFMNPDVLDKLNLPSDDKRRNLIYVRNPLRKEDSVMRTSLIPALLNNVSLNLNRGEKMLRFFEISNAFLATGQKLPDEIPQMAAAYHKEEVSNIWQSRHDGFYDLKGALENLFLRLKIGNVSFVKDSEVEPYLHPGKSSSIMIEDNKIGCVGTLHPGVADAFGIKGDITVAEIYNTDTLLRGIPVKKMFVPLPKYPYIERDAALVVHDDLPVSDVRNEVLSVESDIIEDVALFDIYKGKPIPKDKKSIAFSIRYRSPEKTLTDSEVDALHAEIIKRLQENLKAELR